jgi:hypothetical protein
VNDETGLHSELALFIVAEAQAGELDEDRLAARGYLKLQSMRGKTTNQGDPASGAV